MLISLTCHMHQIFSPLSHTHTSKIKLGFLLTVESRWQKISFTHPWTGWTTRTNRRSKLNSVRRIPSRCWFSFLNLNRGYCALPGSFQRLLSRYGPECDRCIVVVKCTNNEGLEIYCIDRSSLISRSYNIRLILIFFYFGFSHKCFSSFRFKFFWV